MNRNIIECIESFNMERLKLVLKSFNDLFDDLEDLLDKELENA